MGWKKRLKMYWPQALGDDGLKGLGWTDRFEKIQEVAQVKRHFAVYVVIHCLALAGFVSVTAYYGHLFNIDLLDSIPGIVVLLVSFWTLCTAYTHRRMELAGEKVDRRKYKLTILRQRFALPFGFFGSLMAVSGIPWIRAVFRSDTSTLPPFSFWLVSGALFLLLWHTGKKYRRLKRDLADCERDAN